MENKVIEKSRIVVQVWKQQRGRVFESMGGDNPRAEMIDEAITNLEEVLIRFDSVPKLQTIDDVCNAPEGTFKAFIARKESYWRTKR